MRKPIKQLVLNMNFQWGQKLNEIIYEDDVKTIYGETISVHVRRFWKYIFQNQFWHSLITTNGLPKTMLCDSLS